jgi:hypothetical protein
MYAQVGGGEVADMPACCLATGARCCYSLPHAAAAAAQCCIAAAAQTIALAQRIACEFQ